MRFLVLTDRYPPLYEGAYEINCQLVIDGLKRRGHEAVVLTTTYGLQGPRVEGDVHRTLHFHDFFYRNELHRRVSQAGLALKARANYRMAERLAASVRPDLVFTWHMLTASILPILAVQDLGFKSVLQISSHWLLMIKESQVDDPNGIKRLYHRALTGFRGFEELDLSRAIMGSGSLRESHVAAGLEMGNSPVLPVALPDELIAAQPARRTHNGTLKLVFAGRLAPDKGVHVAIEALALLAQQGLEELSLDIYGTGSAEYTAALRQLIAGAGLESRVRLAGFVPQRELVPRLQQYDAMLLPSVDREGLPSTMLEAMAQGVPVIGSDIGGPRDAIRPGETGLLVQPNDANALACAIRDLADAPERLGEWGKSCIKYIRTHYSYEHMIDQYERALLKFWHDEG